MTSITLITALACAAVMLTTWLMTRPRRPGPRCQCGADASIIIDQQWYCARHAWEQLDRQPPRS